MNKNHYGELDISRGIAILGVVLIHTSSLYLSNFYNHNLTIINILARYSVPLFLLISGFLYKSRPGFEAVYKRFQQIMIPYFFFSVLYLAIRIALEHTPHLNSMIPIRYVTIESLFKAIFLVKDNPAGHLYFLPLLFFTFILFTMLGKLIKNTDNLIFLCVISSYASYITSGDVYLSINPLKGIGFFALGFALRKSTRKLHYPLLCLISMIVCSIGYLNVPAGEIKNGLAFGMQLFGALFVYNGSVLLSGSPSYIVSALSGIGRYSFEIYLLHEPYIVTVLSVILLRLSIRNVIINQVTLIFFGISIPILLVKFIWAEILLTLRRSRSEAPL